jgi:hypothetical protein
VLACLDDQRSISGRRLYQPRKGWTAAAQRAGKQQIRFLAGQPKLLAKGHHQFDSIGINQQTVRLMVLHRPLDDPTRALQCHLVSGEPPRNFKRQEIMRELDPNRAILPAKPQNASRDKLLDQRVCCGIIAATTSNSRFKVRRGQNQALPVGGNQRSENPFCRNQVLGVEAAQDALEISGEYSRRAAQLLVCFEGDQTILVPRVIEVVTDDLQLRRVDAAGVADVSQQTSYQLGLMPATNCPRGACNRKLSLCPMQTLEPVLVMKDLGYRRF